MRISYPHGSKVYYDFVLKKLQAGLSIGRGILFLLSVNTRKENSGCMKWNEWKSLLMLMLCVKVGDFVAIFWCACFLFMNLYYDWIYSTTEEL